MARNVAARFAEEHPIEPIRGRHKLCSSAVRRVFAQRAAYLTKRIQERAALQVEAVIMVDELKALAQVMEAFEIVAEQRARKLEEHSNQ